MVTLMLIWSVDHSFSTYGKFSEKIDISYPLICTGTCAYQEVRNVRSSENFAYVLNEWFPGEAKNYDATGDVFFNVMNN